MNGDPGQKNFFLRQAKKLSLDVVVLLLIFIFCTWMLFLIADMVFEDMDTSFDNMVFSFVDPYINEQNTRLMLFITFFGSHLFLLPANIVLSCIFLFFRNLRHYSIKIASISITSTAVMFLLKEWLQRQRPIVPLISKAHGYSFPSGHSFSSFVFFGMLAYISFATIKSNWLKWFTIFICGGMIFLVGFSRIYLKLHFASDVIAGFCLGMIWLLLAKWLLVKTEKMVENTAHS